MLHTPAITMLPLVGCGERVLVIDDATRQAEHLIAAAARAPFEPAGDVGSGYPGLLGPVPRAYADALVAFVMPLLPRHFDTGPIRPARVRCNLSLATTPPDALNDLQTIPHADSANPLHFAAVHYLCDDHHGGTGFFRHRATGHAVLTPEHVDPFNAAVGKELARSSAKPCYPDETHPHFALIGHCRARMDRLVIYRSSLFHSALIPRLPDDPADPRKRRLTGNLFLQCVPLGDQDPSR
jgi:hypothetical protein